MKGGMFIVIQREFGFLLEGTGIHTSPEASEMTVEKTIQCGVASLVSLSLGSLFEFGLLASCKLFVCCNNMMYAFCLEYKYVCMYRSQGANLLETKH